MRNKKGTYKYWAIEDFLCSNFECAGCDHDMEKHLVKKCDEIWFEKYGKKLGAGGFGSVFEAQFHGNVAAYKKIKIDLSQEFEKNSIKFTNQMKIHKNHEKFLRNHRKLKK